MLTIKNPKDNVGKKEVEDKPHLSLVVDGGHRPLKPGIASYYIFSGMWNIEDVYYIGLSNLASISQWFLLSLPSISLSYLKFSYERRK